MSYSVSSAEPTNHLDLRAVLWLEEYLQRWKKTLVVVSHDRDFLNTVCTDVVHLHDLKLTSYRGNFAQFEEMYEQRRREANRAFEKYEKQLKAAKATSSKAKIEKVQLGGKAAAAKRAQAAGGDSDDEARAGRLVAARQPSRAHTFIHSFAHASAPLPPSPPLPPPPPGHAVCAHPVGGLQRVVRVP